MTKLPDFLKDYLLRPASDTVNAVSLGIATAEDITIPADTTGANSVILSATGNFYAQTNGNAATVPGDTTNGTAAELNPVGYFLYNPDTGVRITKLSVISPAACVVTAAFYK